MIITRRFNLLRHWFSGSRQNVGFFELLKHLLAPISKYKAKKFISEINEDKDYYIVKLVNLANVFYYPKRFGINSLYQVISETYCIDDWHYYEAFETKVGQGDIVLDCGAAEGLFSLVVAKRCQKVYCVEPLSDFIMALEKTFANIPNVEIVPLALGARAESGFMTDDGFQSKLFTTPTDHPVNVVTIDSLFYEKNLPLTYIKVDLEGYELEMLAGAKETIKLNRPKIAITTYHKAEHAVAIAKFLKDIHSDYNIRLKGIEERAGAPVMLHAW